MKCSDIQDNLATYADGYLGEAGTSILRGHLDACPLCRERLAEYREIRAALQDIARPDISAVMKGRIKRSVIEEARRSRGSWLPFTPEVREFLERRVLPYGVGSLAAVSICAGFLAVMFSGILRTGPMPAAKEPVILAANHDPFVKEGDVSPSELVRSRLGLAGESPSINPQGALVALTKSFVEAGMKGNDEVVVVADVYSDGLAQIAEVVEPSRDRRAVNELEKALDSSLDNAPFVPASIEARPESVRVVLKLQSVDVHANSKRRARWQ